MKRAAVPSILVAVVLLAVAVIADAQQTGKVPRIGFLDNSTAAGSAGLLKVFWQEMRKLDGLKEKTSPSSIGLQSKSLSGYLSLRRTWFV